MIPWTASGPDRETVVVASGTVIILSCGANLERDWVLNWGRNLDGATDEEALEVREAESCKILLNPTSSVVIVEVRYLKGDANVILGEDASPSAEARPTV